MSVRAASPGARSRHIELLLMLAVIAGLADVYQVWWHQGFLPPPFVFDVNDTFMDWFNTAQYAHNPGAYDIWRSVYAPLSFVFLKVFGFSGCYQSSPFDSRDCDTFGRVAIYGTYLTCCVVTAIALWRRDRVTAPYRSVAFALGLPLLYALERGNLIMVTYLCFAVAHGGIVRQRWVRALGVATSINFKTYMLFAAAGELIRRRWRFMELAGLLTVFVYLVSLAWMGSGTPLVLMSNISDWLKVTGLHPWDVSYYSTSYAPLLQFDVRQFPLRGEIVPSRIVDAVKLAVVLIVRSGQLAAALALLGAWLQPKALTVQRMALLGLLFSFVAQNPGGYAFIFIVFLVFLEQWDRTGPKIAILMAYLLSIPYDYQLGTLYNATRDSWLSNRTVDYSIGIGLGEFVRPGLMAVILYALAADSLLLVARAWRETPPVPWLRPRRPAAPAIA